MTAGASARRACRSRRLTLARGTASRTSSRPMPRAASACGSTWMRTADFCWPKTLTCATPSIVEMRARSIVSAYSSTVESGSVGEVTRAARSAIGRVDLAHTSAGSASRRQLPRGGRAMADCTSCAAASMLRSSRNWSVIWVEPSALVECHRVDAGDGRELRSRAASRRSTPSSRHRRPAGCGHQDGREIDVRQLVHRQREVAEQSGEQERRHDQRGHHRPADEEL